MSVLSSGMHEPEEGGHGGTTPDTAKILYTQSIHNSHGLDEFISTAPRVCQQTSLKMLIRLSNATWHSAANSTADSVNSVLYKWS